MKKLMFVAAVAAGMVAFGDAIESQNIVGYNTTSHRQYYTLVVPEFDSVGTEGLNIQTITPDATTLASYGGGKVNIQTFTSGAAMSEKFYYFTAEEADDEETAGWYSDGIGVTLASKTFAKGEGFMLYMPREGGSLTISGEVSLDAKTVPFRQYYTLTGNFRPVPVNIQSLLVPSATILESYGAGKVNIQTFTSGAAMSEKFYYFTAEEADDEETAGWYADGIGVTLATKTFNPGEGFMIYMPAAGDVTFPAVSAE